MPYAGMPVPALPGGADRRGAARHHGDTNALARLRCSGCGAAPEIVLLVRERLTTRAESFALSIKADRWKPLR